MTTPSDGSHEKAQHAPRPPAALRRSLYARKDVPPPESGTTGHSAAPTSPKVGLQPRAVRVNDPPWETMGRWRTTHALCCLTPHLIWVEVPQGTRDTNRPAASRQPATKGFRGARTKVRNTRHRVSTSKMNKELGRREKGIATGGQIGVSTAADQAFCLVWFRVPVECPQLGLSRRFEEWATWGQGCLDTLYRLRVNEKEMSATRRVRSICELCEKGRGQCHEEALCYLPLEAADARASSADHSVVGILSESMAYLYHAVRRSGVIQTPVALWKTLYLLGGG